MIVLDIETSGVDPKENSILSIGAVDFDKPENFFYGECRLRNGAQIDQKALEINSFTIEKINSCKKSCRKLLEEFLLWSDKIQNKTLAGHNVHFDSSFLFEHFKFYNLNHTFTYRFVDLHSIFYYTLVKKGIEIPLKNNSSILGLDKIIGYLNLEKRNLYHNALEDAQITAKIFSILFNQK